MKHMHYTKLQNVLYLSYFFYLMNKYTWTGAKHNDNHIHESQHYKKSQVNYQK